MPLLGSVPVAPTDPKPTQCLRCDFGTGQRGMDGCGTCDRTGSIFRVKGVIYPNTKAGYIEACQAAGVEPVLE